MPGTEELPDTLKRSPKHAQDIWIAAHDNAVKEYGEGEKTHRTAFAAVEKKYRKNDDDNNWVEK
jgi:cation transport regulator ChaB